MNTEKSGARLLEDHGLSFDYPHYGASTRTASSRVRRRLSIVLCGDRRGPAPLHRISLFGYDEEGRRALESIGLSVHPARKGSSGWRFEGTSTDMSRISEIAGQIQQVLDVSVRPVARLAANGEVALANSLPFLPASSVRPGMLMVDESGEFDVVTAVEAEPIDGQVFDLDIERTHNFVADGIVTHNSVYRFRGADVRNLMRFEETFPEATIIVLDQNYRSTQNILNAANAVIANNPARKPKHLWTEQVGGELLTRYQAEDEHDEAAFVVHEVTRLTDTEGERFSDIAVFYRTNAQSRVIEEALVRAGIPYKVVGGTKFYDRREIKDAMAYLRALVNPDDEVSWKRVVNTPKRGVGDTSVAKVEAYAKHARLTFRDALREAAAAGVSGKALGGIRELLELMVVFEAYTLDGVGAVVERILDLTGYVAELEVRALDRGTGPHREPRRARRRVPGVRPGARRGRGLGHARDRRRGNTGRRGHRPHDRRARRPRAGAGVPRGGVARHGARRVRRRAERRHPDDAAHREGTRVPGGLHHRARGRHLPALALTR